MLFRSYLSNVEQYLFQGGRQQLFYDNVATFPLADTAVFIRPYAMRRSAGQPLCRIGPFLEAAHDGLVSTNTDALACVR